MTTDAAQHFDDLGDHYGTRHELERRLRCGFVNCDLPAHPSGACSEHSAEWSDLARLLA